MLFRSIAKFSLCTYCTWVHQTFILRVSYSLKVSKKHNNDVHTFMQPKGTAQEPYKVMGGNNYFILIGQLVWHDGCWRASRWRWLAGKLGPIELIILVKRGGGATHRLNKNGGVWRGASFHQKPTTLVEGRMLENKRDRLKSFLRKIDEKAVIRIKHFMKERWGNGSREQIRHLPASIHRVDANISIEVFPSSVWRLGCFISTSMEFLCIKNVRYKWGWVFPIPFLKRMQWQKASFNWMLVLAC